MGNKEVSTEFIVSYSGLHTFFSSMFRKGVLEIIMGIQNLTIMEAELLRAVASEYLYILIDMKTTEGLTEILLLNELD